MISLFVAAVLVFDAVGLYAIIKDLAHLLKHPEEG